jgi:hypothetical protein
MVCTARSTNDLTVVRGQDGTAAASHADTEAVSMIYSQQGLTRILADNVRLGGYSGRPPVNGIFADNGISKLTTSDFTWQNQGGAAVSDRGQGILMTVPTDSAFNLRVQEITVPSTPYSYIAAMRCIAGLDADSAPSIGIGFRETSSGKLMLVRVMSRSFFTAGHAMTVTRCSSLTAVFSNLLGPLNTLGCKSIIWFKVENDGTNTKFYVGSDGVEWLQLLSENKATYFSSGPDRVCWFGVNASNSGGGGSSNALATQMNVELLHWSKGE